MKYISQFKDFFQTVKKPKNLINSNPYFGATISEKFIDFVRIFITGELVTIIFGIFQLISIIILFGLFKYDLSTNKLIDYTEGLNFTGANTVELLITGIFVLTLAGIVIPIIEELVFRLHLRFIERNFAISIGLFITYFLIPTMLESADLYNKFGVIPTIILLVSFLISSIIIINLILRRTRVLTFLKSLYEKHFSIVFYLTLLIFGFMHISNYSNMPLGLYLFTPIIVLVQIWLGYVLGYIRMRFGIGFSMLAHIIHNSTLIILLIVIQILMYLVTH